MCAFGTFNFKLMLVLSQHLECMTFTLWYRYAHINKLFVHHGKTLGKHIWCVTYTNCTHLFRYVCSFSLVYITKPL